MTRREKAKVSERAVIGRVNRRLQDDGRKLLTARGWRMRLDVRSNWYVVNVNNNSIVQPYKGMHLEDIARDVGALRDWEEVHFEASA